MKVSSKFILGFIVLTLLAVVILAYQRSTITEMQKVNVELSGINLKSARTALEIQRWSDLLEEDSKKYFLLSLDSQYENDIMRGRMDLLDDVNILRQTSKTVREQEQTEKIAQALDDYWEVFDPLYARHQRIDSNELPQDLRRALIHFQAEADVMVDAVQLAITERVAGAAEIGRKAEQLTWVAAILSLVLGVIVAALIVHWINDPLRRLMQGTRAIAKGQFWHRLPAHGRDEFAELARDFNAMTERLGELDRMKKDFVSHVSHDLKAPLASIRQIMHVLLQEIPGSLNDQQKNLIQLSYKSAERLASMVGNLLDVSRMEAGTMEYRMAAHDIVSLVQGVIDEFDVQAQEKEIRFRLQCHQPTLAVNCDSERIEQVIGNLYENALKFSPSQSEIVTNIGPGKRGEILISVADSGPGVPDGQKGRIFEKFHQVKHGTKVAGQGVGLGLAICKTIVEAHRGQIWVEDNPNGGSVFSFVLHPASQEEVLTCGQTA